MTDQPGGWTPPGSEVPGPPGSPAWGPPRLEDAAPAAPGSPGHPGSPGSPPGTGAYGTVGGEPEYGVAYPAVAPITSGMAIGSMVTGVGSAVVSWLACCFWPFVVLAVLAGGAGVVLGILGMRQVDASRGLIRGKGLAVAGAAAGGGGVLLALLFLVIGLFAFNGGLPSGD